MTPPRIAIATSIPPAMARLDRGWPAGPAYQKLCVQSWIECGFQVLSINGESEIPALAASYPEVAFVPARQLSERKTPRIAELLTALLAQPQTVLGIVNADILFEPAATWRDALPDLVLKSLVAIQRHDTTALEDGALRRFHWGYDCFFFSRQMAEDALASAGDFAMGLPWWDYWFPALAMLKGHKVTLLERPLTLHLHHAQGYRNATLHRYARSFASAVIEGAQDNDVKPELATLLPICREMLASGELAGDANEDRSLSDAFAHRVVPWRDALAANAVKLDPDPGPKNGAFQRIEERLWAGAAAESARYHGLIGKSEDERRLYEMAFAQTPDDIELLMDFAAHLCRSREPEFALRLLTRAAAQQPELPRLLNTKGFALRALGRREDAILDFERALRADPDFREAACNLAVTLFEAGRIDDALACAETVLIKWPDAADLQQLKTQFASGRVSKS